MLLQRGDEDYGVASTVTDFALALKHYQLPVKLVCVIDGALCERLRAAGLEVDVLGIKPPPRVISGNLLKRTALILESKKAQKNIARFIIERYKANPVDVVQSMNYLLLESCGWVAKAFQSTGVWRMGSGVQTARLRQVKQYMMSSICDRHALVSMANSDFTRQSIARKSPLSVVVYHGIDPERFNPATIESATREEFGIGQSDIVFGIFAHIHPNGEKGQHIAVKALCAHLNNSSDHSIPPVHLIIFGSPTDSSYADFLRKDAENCEKLTLHLPGAVPDVEKYYALIDVSLSPRITPEPFGLSVIESMMMGVPVLAHALGGPAETVVDGQTGWLLSDSTVEVWSSAFERVIGVREQWPDFSARARAHALKDFTIEAEVKGWAEQLDLLSS